ncbi:demethylmenaquinone methyltransferase [Cohnella abietis]|uniref:Demethylmenaquinone methyltransferase n=1 Tax=Cohnella abietis TaxID=2507935 RepID=A0A3T1D5F2_9BACL|nr:demethylmenaquinone methyltransferase [Cohnella abietis]BBI33195.1 demethylmenaquinone methyltransferase [Cohnella abietis]
MMEPESKHKHVHAVFESIASDYDKMNDMISFRRHRAWRRFTMRKMDVKPGQTSLDLCCGTCDWTLSLAKASDKGKTIGLDFSRNMLDIGQAKIDKLGMGNQITLVQGDAMDLPFEDNTFDFVTIGFGLRNIPDIVKTLKEMKRVVKPGGKIVCLELSKPTWQPFKALYYFYFNRVLPLMGKWFVKRYEQYRWLPESLVPFPDLQALAELFRSIGMRNVKAYPLTGGVAALHIGTKGNEGV